MHEKTVYRLKVDWWIYSLSIFVVIVVRGMCFDSECFWLSLLTAFLVTAMLVIMFLGCRYKTDDDRLLVYQFFPSKCFPKR